MTELTQLPFYITGRYRDAGIVEGIRDSVRAATLDAERQFDTAFANISASVTKALATPRNTAGSLDLGLGDLRLVQQAHEARAAAAQEAAVAVRAAAQAEGDYSAQARLTVAAAEALAVEERNAAAAARAHADAVEQVQLELNKQPSTIQAVIQNNGMLAVSHGTVRHAMLQSGQQMQDLAISLYSGQQASIVFAQQLPQLAFALSGLEGSSNRTYAAVGRFATFMSSGWGALLGIGIAAIGVLTYELLKSGDASEKTSKSQETFQDSLDRTKHSLKEVVEAIHEYNVASQKSQDTTLQNTIISTKAAAAAINEAIAIRQKTKALLDAAYAEMENPTSAQAGAGASTEVLLLQSKMAAQDKALQDLAKEAHTQIVSLADAVATVNSDPIARLKEGFAKLRDEAKKSIPDFDKLTQRLTELNKQEAAAVKAAQKAGQATRSGETSSFIMPASGTITGRFGETRPGHSHGGVDIAVPVGTSVKAPGAGVVIEAGTLPGYGNVVFIDHGAGTVTRLAHLSKIAVSKGQTVDQGEVIGLSGGAKGAEGSGNSQGPHLHYEVRRGGKAVNPLTANYPTDELGATARATKLAEAAARAQEQLAQFGERSAESIARINERFDEQPRLIDQAAAATRQLDAVIADLSERKPPGFEQMIADARDAKATVEDSLLRPFRDMTRDSERRLQIQGMLAQGHEDEAAAVQEIWRLEDQIGTLTEKQRDSVRAVVTEEQRRTRELERQRGLFEAQLDVLDQAKRSLTDILSGRSTNFFKDIRQSLADLQGKRLFDGLFGDTFQKLEEELRGQSPLGKESQHFANEMSVATDALDGFTRSLNTAAGRTAANDNAALTGGSIGNYFRDIFPDLALGGGLGQTGDASGDHEIVVTAKRPFDWSGKSMVELANKLSGAIVNPFEQVLGDVFGTGFAQMLSGVMKGALSGYLTGGAPGGILGALKGIAVGNAAQVMGDGQAQEIAAQFDKLQASLATGKMAAGIMKSLGIKTSTTGAQIGSVLGTASGIPGGEIVGSIIGGLIGGAFKKVKWGRVLLSSSGSTLQGNSSKAKEAASGAGDSFTESLQNIIDQLGGTMGDFGQISLGVRHGDYRVNLGGTSLKKNKGAVDFDEDSEAAIKYALMEAIKRGAIDGIRASTQQLLQEGDDLDKALKDALDWENVFRELKSYKDPLGAAMDDLDKQFAHYIDLAKQAGASTQEMADLEELYGIKRNEIIKEQAERLIGSLKSLYEDLATGDNGLSLRDRQAAALTTYEALKARVAAGDTTAYDEYATAAQSLLDIERQLYGSQQSYFDRLTEVMDLTKSRIDAETNVTSIAENRDSPFDSAGAVNASIQSQTDTLSGLLSAANENQGTIIAYLATIAAQGGSVSAATAARIDFQSSF